MTQFFGDNAPDICNIQMHPFLMTGAFVSFFRQIFYDSKNRFFAELDNLHWDPDPKKSNLMIESYTRFKPDEVLRRPAILVQRGPQSHSKAAFKHSLGDGRSTGLWEGTHQFIVIGKSGAQVDILVAEIWRLLEAYRSVIIDNLMLHSLDVTRVAETKLSDEYNEHFVSSVEVRYLYFQTLEQVSALPPVRRIGVDVQLKQ